MIADLNELRPRMLSVTYRLLGSVVDAMWAISFFAATIVSLRRRSRHLLAAVTKRVPHPSLILNGAIVNSRKGAF